MQPYRIRRFHARAAGRAGMTLIEIAVVVAIMGVLAVMAMPRFLNLVSYLRSQGAANQLVSDIAYTRMSALREGRTASLTISGTRYTIVVENADATVFKTLRTVDLESSFSGTTLAADGGTGRIAFDSRGMLRSTSATGVTLARGGRSQHLSLNATGRLIRDTNQ
jgi:prepilin-type N-terminal cleavage/methylation domain-containing protein